MSYYSNIVASSGVISLLDMAEACGIATGEQLFITSFYSGGCNIPPTNTGVPSTGRFDFSTMRSARGISLHKFVCIVDHTCSATWEKKY